MGRDALRRARALMHTQGGVLWRPQALEVGLTPKAIDYLLVSGEWIEELPKVYAASAAPNTLDRRYMAAVLWAGPIAAISHRSAAAEHGLYGFQRGLVEVTTTRRGLCAPGLVVHHTKPLEDLDVIQRGGIVITAPARTLIDLVGVVRPHRAEMALDSALSKGLLSAPFMWKEMNRIGTIGRRQTALLRSWVAERLGDLRPSASGSETRLVQLLREAGLQGYCKQFEVGDGEGRMFIDFAFPDLMLGIEIDSWEWHLGKHARQGDARRQNRLERLGWTILRFFWADVMFAPEYVLAEIQRTVEAILKRRMQV